MFKKAKPVSSRLKATFYGGPGAGKTYTALLIAEGLAEKHGKRIAYIDAEGGTRHYRRRRPGDPIHPEPFDFDLLETKSLSEATTAVGLIDPRVHCAIIVDQVTWFYNSCIETYKRKKGNDDMQPQDWPRAKKPYIEFVNLMMHGPLDVILLSRERHVFRTNADGQMEYVGVSPRCDQDTPHEGDILMHLHSEQDKRDPTRTTYQMWCEKDRTSTLSGRVLCNTTYKDFEPLIELLGEGHDVSTSEEDALQKDVEAAAKREAIEAEKEAEREAAKREFEAEILRARTKGELDEIAKKIKKSPKVHAKQRKDLHKPFQDAQARLVRAGGE